MEGIKKIMLATAIMLCLILVVPALGAVIPSIRVPIACALDVRIDQNFASSAETIRPNDPGSGGGGQGVVS